MFCTIVGTFCTETFFLPPMSMQTFKKLKKYYYLKLPVFSVFLREYCNLDSRIPYFTHLSRDK